MISVFLSILMLLSALVACNVPEETSANEQTTEFSEEKTTEKPTESETPTETETETETEPEELVLKDDFYSFSDHTSSTRSLGYFENGKEYAVYFEIPEGQLKTFSLQLCEKSDDYCNYVIELFKCEKINSNSNNIPAIIDEHPIFDDYIQKMDFKSYVAHVEDKNIGAGCYLLKVSSPDYDEYKDHIMLGKAWIRTITAEYEQFNMRTFIDGKAQKKQGLYGGFVLEHNVPISKVGELNEEKVTDKDEGDKVVKVILLSGQSNATGASMTGCLKENVSSRKWDEYTNGYSNVKILHFNGSTGDGSDKLTNGSDNMFVDTVVGQGHQTYQFGPELGLAEYLSETYPDETFYIIKYALGGVSMAGYYNLIDNKDFCHERFKEIIDQGLDLLVAEGLDPKIVAFLWMQGESDCGTLPAAYNYYNLQKAMVEDLRTEYADFTSVRGMAFINAAISDHCYWSQHLAINSMKKQYAYDSVLNYYIDTNAEGLDTLQENNDQAHYDSLSMIKLGRLFGEVVSQHID
jgi:hypothetical protein